MKAVGINKRATVHTLRHSYATHLLEAGVNPVRYRLQDCLKEQIQMLSHGVNLRQIQEYLGHKSPATTAIYTHLTAEAQEHAKAVINQLMEGL